MSEYQLNFTSLTLSYLRAALFEIGLAAVGSRSTSPVKSYGVTGMRDIDLVHPWAAGCAKANTESLGTIGYHTARAFFPGRGGDRPDHNK